MARPGDDPERAFLWVFAQIYQRCDCQWIAEAEAEVDYV
jgi:hypothetical protein